MDRAKLSTMNYKHATACLICLIAARIAASDVPVPNLILIMADDLGYGDLSCYGNTEVETAELDRLAAEGLRFTDFHSSGNVCSPTRAGLLTGRYQQRAGLPGVINADPKLPVHHHGLGRHEATFAESVKTAGYATAIQGKWHLGYGRFFNPVHHGFDEFHGFVSGNVDYHSHYDRMEMFDWWDGLDLVHEQGYSTHLVAKHGIDFIGRNQHRPFCLYLAHEAVHAPWQGPRDAIQRGPNKTNQAVDSKRAFREMLLELDRSVGQIRAEVERLELQERTLIFFCSDNGPAGGSAGPLRGRKGSNWEGGHRVPGIAWWPGQIAAGRESHDLAITLDLMPTFVELAGQSPTRPLDGTSLVALFLRGKSLGPRQLYWNGKAMRDGPWKLVRQAAGGPEIGLFNLDDDLGEQHNLASAEPARVARMLESLDAWTTDVTSTAARQD
jgi:arylsulfatase A-like enzyme